MHKYSSRKSTLKSQEEFLFGDEKDPFDFSTFIDPYLELKREYEALKMPFIKKVVKRAYTVTYNNIKGLLYITFTSNRYKAKGEATKYFRNNMHPDFIENKWRKEHLHARARLAPDLDKYAKEELVPIPAIMKMGASFPCSVCGKENFKYQDYKNKRCFIVEGEGNLNKFTKGYILCYTCWKKYLSQVEEG